MTKDCSVLENFQILHLFGKFLQGPPIQIFKIRKKEDRNIIFFFNKKFEIFNFLRKFLKDSWTENHGFRWQFLRDLLNENRYLKENIFKDFLLRNL